MKHYAHCHHKAPGCRAHGRGVNDGLFTLPPHLPGGVGPRAYPVAAITLAGEPQTRTSPSPFTPPTPAPPGFLRVGLVAAGGRRKRVLAGAPHRQYSLTLSAHFPAQPLASQPSFALSIPGPQSLFNLVRSPFPARPCPALICTTPQRAPSPRHNPFSLTAHTYLRKRPLIVNPFPGIPINSVLSTPARPPPSPARGLQPQRLTHPSHCAGAPGGALPRAFHDQPRHGGRADAAGQAWRRAVHRG